MKSRRPPTPPSFIPIMFLLASGLLALGAWAVDTWTKFPWWVVLSVLPFVLILFAVELKHVSRRRQICEHIREDFISEEVGIQADYSSLLNEIHASQQSAHRRDRALSLQASGPTTWPTE